MRIRCLFFILTILFTCLPLSFAIANRPMVKLIYFLPNNRRPQPGIDEKINTLIKEVQQFFADEMEANGFGRKTFQLETDAAGNAIVHHIVGRFSNRYYNNLANTWEVWNEMDDKFDSYENIYLTFIDISNETLNLNDGGVCGIGGSRGHLGGKALIPASGDCFNLNLTAHELGHAFGLQHDFRDDIYIMSYGWSSRSRLSQCACEWLNVHRVLNSGQPNINNKTQIKMLPQSFASPPNATRFLFKIIDQDGLHQAQLMTPTLTGSAQGSLELISCKVLNGSKNTIIEFVSNALTPNNESVSLQVIDVHGNFVVSEMFPIDITNPVDSTVNFPDANLRLKITEALGKSSNARITAKDMLTLTNLNANNADINEINGLQYAENLTTLTLNDNNIINVDLLFSLTELKTLSIDNNNIVDVVGISFLKQLETLSLENNKISDILPFAELTELKTLHLSGNLLNYSSLYTFIPAMQKSGINVAYDIRTPTELIRKSPYTNALAGTSNLVDVTVQDENGIVFPEVPVTFTVTTKDGNLTKTEAVTDHTGTAYAYVLLGPTAGENTVRASVKEIPQSLIFVITTIDADRRVNIPDGNLHAIIANKLGQSSNSQLTARDMSKLTQLEAPNASIQNLIGIEYAYNLKELDLGSEYIDGVGNVNNNTILDFSPLKRLNQLNILDLNISTISDISFLANLKQLETLSLWRNTITDISPLAGLTQLKYLNLDDNDISDVIPLSGLTQLEYLYLSINAISDISSIAGLTQLKNLWLPINAISDISSIAGLTQLKYLSLDGNDISDVIPLSGLTQLEYLYLTFNNISDVSPLLKLNLTSLNLKSNPLSYESISKHIPAIQVNEIVYDNIAHPTLIKISGDEQKGVSGTLLTAPFLVEVQDERGKLMNDVSVTFTIHSGSGILSPTITQTDANGKARTTLTLGWTPGITTIKATAANIKSYVFFKTHTSLMSDRIPEDVNGDGSVDVEDLVLVAASFGTIPSPGVLPNTDVNGDGVINQTDVELVLESVPSAPSSALTAESLQRRINEAKQITNSDEIFQRGIAMLEALLVSLTPIETALLPNYPNPFNPETWIPYQLAQPSDVSITIYDIRGNVVRKLLLGHKQAGFYTDRNRAAHWDGRNNTEERVANGVYFIQLKAGDSTYLRKMLIVK